MTQNERILHHMEFYGSISQIEAVYMYGIMRLASRISELKKQGVEINREICKGKNRYGDPVYFTRYSLGGQK